ncbi:hypothetical protein [Aliikangiella sp. G2MR2-5]|uniref:hypothetical protein n=1 Tax=Aliikangiella sp. G2MR2-5 TaxID=2788943 RepID=UPI0018A979F6|nr:hypothetical protein [Aliikangiella sp. G2MR2-5]
MEKIIKYFDLYSNNRSNNAEFTSSETGGRIHWSLQYFALVLGIYFEPVLSKYHETKIFEFSISAPVFFLSALVGIAIFPSVYKTSFDTEKPTFVALCVIFVTGLGWQSTLNNLL